jgi:glycosyltransferase involved in cell wall biosynthesis
VRLLVLSFYYPPDLSAGSFRATAIVDALRSQAPLGTAIDIITTQPNRYHAYELDAPETEQHENVTIRRVRLPKHHSGLLDQGFAALTFFRSAAKLASGKKYDVVFATSGRLLTAVLGSFIARRSRAALYLDIRDIFVENITDLALRRVRWIAKPFFSMLEAWAINRAQHVNLVSRGFADYFSRRYPRQRFSYLPNGIDEEFVDGTFDRPGGAATNGAPLTVVYAGNIGEGQGLHAVIPPLAKRMGSGVRFRIIGDGGRRQALEAALARAGVSNVEIHPPVRRSELLTAYRDADVLFLHLNDYTALATALPSKVFEYGATGKPIWAGVTGYAASFVRSEIGNSAVFHPCDVDGAINAFASLRLEQTPRADFVAAYARSAISRKLAAGILALGTGR